jgi:hypothetical protein
MTRVFPCPRTYVTSFLILSLTLSLSCGGSIRNAQGFIPNKAPLITKISAADLNGNTLDSGSIVNNMQIKITVEASDPEAQNLSYEFSSERGSFSGLTSSGAGCVVYCFTRLVAGGQDVVVNVTVRDPKNASASTSLNLGTGKQGPLLAMNGFDPEAMKSNAAATLSFSSTCDGYYRIVETDSIADDSDAAGITGPIYQYFASADASNLATETINIAGHDSAATSNLVLSAGEGSKKIWVVFWDSLNQYSYNYAPIVVDNTSPSVASHIPESGATGISSSTSLSFTFTEIDEIDASTLAGALSVSPSSGITIENPSYSNHTAIFPVSGIRSDTIYTVKLATTVTDRAGNSLDTSSDTNSFRFSRNMIPVTGVTVTPSSTVITIGAAKQLNAEAAPSASSQEMSWSTNNSNVAQVDDDGLVTGTGCGTARITATTADGGYSSYCDIRVDPSFPFTISQAANVKSYTTPSTLSFSTVTTPSLPSGATFPVGQNDSSYQPVPSSFEMAVTENRYDIWNEVCIWATNTGEDGIHREDGGTIYTFANNGSNGSSNSGTKMPATKMSWADAMIWCNALTEYYNSNNGAAADLSCAYTYNGAIIRDATSTGVLAILFTVQEPTATGFRLPTNIEWEFAARYIGTTLPNHTNYILKDGYYYYKGTSASGASGIVSTSDTSPTTAVAWCGENSSGGTHSAGTLTENALGIYDMSGNVWEWVFDWDTTYTYTKKIQRGGSYGDAIALSSTRLMLYYKDAVLYSQIWPSYGFRFCRNP